MQAEARIQSETVSFPEDAGIPLAIDLPLYSFKPFLELNYALYDGGLTHARIEEKKAAWESVRELQNRVRGVLDAYHGQYGTLIVACHSMVIKSMIYKRHINYGEIVSLNYHPDQPFTEWVFEN